MSTRDMLCAKDIARLEGCHVDRAHRLMDSGELGPVFAPNARVKQVDRKGYDAWRRRHTRVARGVVAEQSVAVGVVSA